MCCFLYHTKVLHPRFQSYKLHKTILGKVKVECKCKVSAEIKGRECKIPTWQHGDFYQDIGKQCFPLVLIIGAPLKGMFAQGHKLPGRVTPWIANGPSHAQVGLRLASSGCSRHLH
jgi:hypothetical protein